MQHHWQWRMFQGDRHFGTLYRSYCLVPNMTVFGGFDSVLLTFQIGVTYGFFFVFGLPQSIKINEYNLVIFYC